MENEMKDIIRMVRGRQVILDADLARLYGVETKVLNQTVKRNIERFPEDFMFQLTKEEVSRSQFATLNEVETINLKSQFVTSSQEKDRSRSQFVTLNGMDTANLKSQFATSSWGGVRKLPYAFTEQGIAMLSGILRSPTAIEVNIRIMRAFVEMRHFVIESGNIFNRIDTLEQRQLATENKIDKVFSILEQKDNTPNQGIFYNGQIFDAHNFVCDLIREAQSRIVLIDNYIDDTVLKRLSKRSEGVTATIYTQRISQVLQTDLNLHNKQYPPIEIKSLPNFHDRFLIIDNTVYHIGASIKDLGKKVFAFSKMNMNPECLLL